MYSESIETDSSSVYLLNQQAVRQRALRKNAWRLLPLLTLAFIFNYIDRTSVGFAALTMNQDIGLTPAQFGWGAGVLFAGYCLFEIPSNLALYRYGARRWLARIMITWGLASTATCLVQGPTSFYVLRLLLGIAEAGFFPGVTFFLACWFPAQYRVRVLAFFMLGVPLSSVLGGPLSAALLGLDGMAGLHGWQWMFIVQGVPAVVIGFAVLAWLRDDPKDAYWLTQEERTELVTMLQEEPREKPKRALFSALRDGRVLLLAAIQFGFVLGSYGIGIWLPVILKGHGFNLVRIGALSTIPYIAAVFGMLIWARAVDRSGRRVFHLVSACLLGAIGLALSAVANGIVIEIVGLSLAVIAVSSARAIFWTIPTRFLTGVAAAGGLAFINSIGTLGGFAGPYLVGFLKQSTGTFSAGIWAMAGVLAVAAALAASLTLVIKKA
ncbi:MFS transporter [Paraburkholderia sp. BL25I1N1]|uniref:MFS transporter n=1 Tax=Paraburkholderia sp. BL25I1N1 TaxID=1938804 RepID=UPI000D07BAB9|nr:MFS transporter [Paraburkholderia sp. BL25I1N1]PRY04538.1 sugar phosphate permease [Paraburkholderia sp. BL25I1N1]